MSTPGPLLAIFLLLTAVSGAVGQTPTPTPPVIKEEVVVIANRAETALGDTPASVATFPTVRLETAAAPTIDDILRQSVGFSIFRRTSSRHANPTTQGVSLRGVGASGASRSAIMFDGVPLNDPFGGWVQWNRVSPVEVERIEVLRGGASSLYGESALSGAISVVPKTSQGKRFSIDVSAGSQKTWSPAAYVGFGLGRNLSADLTAAYFQTRGYIPIDPAVRGPVDTPAGVRSGNHKARITKRFGQHMRLFFSPTYFGEVRANGTRSQINRTHIRQFVFGGDVKKNVEASWRSYLGTQVYDQTFSAVNAARTVETLNRVQRVPVQNIGFTGQISKVFGQHHLTSGGDAKNVRGASDEIAIGNNVATSLIGAGGRQTTVGAFIQDFMRFGGRLVVAARLRADHWANYRAFSSTRTLSTGQVATTSFSDRSENALSPQLSVLYHISDRSSVYVGASRSFRAPTLNELYRSFRVGNVVTLFNENLRAERATNVEGGVSFSHKRIRVRTAAFWTSIDSPIANVTLSTTPALITRQRQNAGDTRSAGIEIEGETSIGDDLVFAAGYLFADAVVTSFPSTTTLVGLRIPQVARHQFTAHSRYNRDGWTIAAQLRASGSQFDDDLNQFRLERFAQLDLYGARRFSGFEIYGAVENVFNTRYSVARTPIRSVSAPLSVRMGLRLK